MLILCLDQGFIGWPAALFLYQQIGIQGWLVNDPFHRLWNDLRLALANSGLGPLVREMMLLFNHRAGPWDAAGFLQQARGAVEELKGFDDHNNIFFAF